ncbi:MAG: aminotransferase class V-fold PLP-dependent enzyme [Propionicimonas sp.]|uniref:aminotransferase class V-fold PLP-dependent enzyme n=1 Tax=Propionicimonas sp. TaxID=1955623 RepID=UPI002B201BF8|nr:aminotransferase class V-fold PLP-dependent enzyme [Propionicimonas sp.]MEA4945200.1 aminotransferase class V-fold PLP-dependent enzyme [Propionicimonas sp.]MEA5052850.1 aminotransferase class V-fold PLP-dependent enzyme [Propionicimonas sp.]
MPIHHTAPEGVVVVDPEPRWTLDPRVRHLNHGSFGAVPEAVQAEQDRLRRLVEWNPVRWFASQPERIAAARAEMAALLRVDPARLGFVLNASAGASVVYQSLLGRGPVDVLVTDHGYGAVTMGAQRLATRTGGHWTMAHIPLDATADDVVAIITAEFDRHRPSLLVIDQITSATARAFPVEELCRLARSRGVLSLVDGAHAPGVLADPVCREADYWVGNLHKFACSPRGAAVLVSRGDGQELFPLTDSWGAHLPYPERFDHNGTMDLTAWLVAPFAWRHLDQTLGWANIRTAARQLMDEACALVAAALDGLVDDPLPDVGQPVGPMRLVRLPGELGGSHDEADALRVPFSDAVGIAGAFTEFGGRGYFRLSAHAYNALPDYQYLATVGIPLLHQWSVDRNRGTSAS